MEFQNKAPEWDAVGIEPSENLKTNGFVAGYKPPAQIFNFLFNRISASITELQNVSVPKVKLTSESLDTVKDEGLYYAAAGNTVTGKPSGVNAFGLAVIKVSDTDYAQVLYSSGSTQFRFFNSTAWSGWGVYAKQADLTAHTGNKSNPHGVTAAQIGAATTSALSSHTSNKENPHAVTKTQVGLGSVPNVSTNDQTPTFTVASSNTALTSGEKLSVAFGKIAKAISSLISHLANKNNPHGVTASQIGAAAASSLATHTGDKNNPHGVTPEQINAVSRTRCRIVEIGGSFWSDTAPYTYTWSDAEIKETDRPIVSCGKPYSLDAESFESAMRNFNRIDYAEVGNGFIKFYCYTERPGNTFLFIKY